MTSCFLATGLCDAFRSPPTPNSSQSTGKQRKQRGRIYLNINKPVPFSQLAARLESEPTIPAASTFRTLEEAEALASKSLATHHQDILEFLKGKKDKLLIRDSSTQPVGLSVIRGTKNSVPSYKFLLVIMRKPKMPDGYLLLTGYPIEK